jgi:hypothetical protein
VGDPAGLAAAHVEVRDDEADRLDSYGYRAEATEQRQAAVKLARVLLGKLDGTAEAADGE